MRFNGTLFAAALLCCNTVFAQEMTGFRTDNYSGVNGAFFNPANLGNSRFKVDVNLLGMNIFMGNKNIKFASETLSDANDTGSITTIFGDKPNDILTNLALHLPSVSYSINENTTVALLSRVRVLSNIHDFDGKLLSSISDQDVALPYTLSGNTNMRMNVNMFSEFGVSGGHVVYNKGKHFIKVGATLKYLAGVQNYYLQINKLTGTIDSSSNGDAIITKSTGTFAIGGGGMDYEDFDFNLQLNAGGFGADLGAVYEYRPDNLKDESVKYLFKANLAILDLGSIKYTAVPNTFAYDINIPAGKQFNLNELDNQSGSDINSVLDRHPDLFKRTAGLNKSEYRVSLPRTLQLGGDVRAMKNIYVAANLQLAMVNNESKPYNPRSINSIVVTPRYESPLFAAYLPISYNNLSKMNMGIGLRAGPLHIGSSSMLSRAFGNKKQLDFYFGFRFGFKTKQKANDDSK